MLSGLLILTGLTLLGPILLPLWMGPEMQVGWPVLLAFSLYFLAHAWAHAIRERGWFAVRPPHSGSESSTRGAG